MDAKSANGDSVVLRGTLGRTHATLSEAGGRSVLLQRVPNRRPTARSQPVHDGSCRGAENRHLPKQHTGTVHGALAGHDGLEPHPQVTLARLWERYRRECETFRDTDQTHQSDTATRAAILIAYFGADYDVERLSKDAQRRYERARAAGGVRYQHERRVVRFGRVQTETVLQVSQPTRARSAEADLVLLHAMLNWATTVRDASAAKPCALAPCESSKGNRAPAGKESASTCDVSGAIRCDAPCNPSA